MRNDWFEVNCVLVGGRLLLSKWRRLRSAVLVAILLVLLLPTISFAYDSAPILTGTWKLNPKLSRLVRTQLHGDDVYKIKHVGEILEITHIFFDGSRQVLSIVIDGKKRLASGFPEEITARAYWDAGVLVIEKQQNVRSATQRWTCKDSLSADGKVLTILIHVQQSSLSPAFDEELVLEKTS